MKQFDEKLTNKIISEFENFSPEYNPEHWNLMKQKLQKNNSKKIIPIFPFWAKAAVITLFFTTTLMTYLFLNESKKNNIRYSENIYRKTYKSEIKIKQTKFDNKKSENKFVNKKTYNKKEINKVEISKITGSENVTEAQIEQNLTIAIDSLEYYDFEIAEAAENYSEPYSDFYGKKQNVEPLLISDKKTSKQIKFGAMLAGNSSANSNFATHQLGMTLGMSSEIPVSKKISVNTGLLFTAQEFNLAANNENYNVYKTVNNVSFDASTQNLTVTSNISDVNIIAIDIPLNIQYQLLKNKKNSVYCMAGVSSFAYVKQQFTGTNVYGIKTDDEISFYQNTFQTNEPAFKYYDFAKVVNFGLSYRYKMQKGEIAIEPYIKYPYKPITSEALNISFAGIFFRYIF